MKLPLSLFAGALLVSGSTLRADPLVQPNDLVAIAGDSITEQKIYSVYIEDYLLMCQPVPGVSTLQFGAGGAGAYVVGMRTPYDLALFHPNVVTMLYGMNDGQYQPLNDERAAGFRKGTTDSVDAIQKIGTRVVLVSSPTCVDWANQAANRAMYNKTLASFGDMAKEIAQSKGVAFTDCHGIMAGVIAKGEAADGPSYSLGGDGVHQGPAGHLVMAYAILKGLGFDGAIGTITVDLGLNRATGTPGQKIISVQGGTVQIESTRYPFCFTGDPAKPDTTTNLDVLKYLPFNDDLNRYLLVVQGLTTARAKVTWGDSSQEFAATDLAKGINLAAAFAPNNPFSAPFAKVDAAALAQQKQETLFTKNFLGDFNQMKADLPDQTDTFDQIIKSGMNQRDTLVKAAAALVIPVDHTIKIEPLP